MKQRLGGILCVIFGAVLIGTGLSSGGGSGVVGSTPIDCTGGNVGLVVACPVAQITFFKTVQGTDPSPPASWTVHVTSTCTDPASGIPVNQIVNVPSGGSASTGNLFVYTSSAHTTLCSYSYVEDPLPSNCTSLFAPASPQTLAIRVGLDVDVTNTCNVVTTTPPPPPTSTSATSATPTRTITDTSSAVSTPAPSGSTTAPISNTGPREQVRASVWIGIALCVLGFVLVVAGRRTGRRALGR